MSDIEELAQLLDNPGELDWGESFCFLEYDHGQAAHAAALLEDQSSRQQPGL